MSNQPTNRFDSYIENLAEEVHKTWVSAKLAQGITSRKSEKDEELMVEYKDLPEEAKQSCRDMVITVEAARIKIHNRVMEVTEGADFVKHLEDCLQDPMWADHVQISKSTLELAVQKLKGKEAQIEQLQKQLDACSRDMRTVHAEIEVDRKVRVHGRPVHPGEVLKHEFLVKGSGYDTVDKLSCKTGLPKGFLSQLVQGKVGVGDIVALELSKAYGTTTEFWINLQNSYNASINALAEKHISRKKLPPGVCPECRGSGELGGQFCGGQVETCSMCAGTGKT